MINEALAIGAFFVLPCVVDDAGKPLFAAECLGPSPCSIALHRLPPYIWGHEEGF
jgi:hypothetical protein